LDKEEKEAKTEAEVTAVIVQGAREEVEKKTAVLKTKKGLSKMFSDCAELLEIDLLDELWVNVYTMEGSARRFIPLASEGLGASDEGPTTGVEVEPTDDEGASALLYTNEGYPYYIDEQGESHWYYAEEHEYGAEQDEYGNPFAENEH
jgi:hypothetical protein